MREIVPNLPEPKRLLLEQLVGQLSRVPGVAAVVLGGSYASGTHHAASDMDVGLYYAEAAPFAVAAIRQIAQALAADGAPTVTDFYEWGAWVNGGAWITTAHGKVDFLYRNLDQVRRTIADAQQGRTQHDYDQQPTHGFYSVTYLAETQICVPLHDPQGLIAQLKQGVETYPPALKQAILRSALWSAEFSLIHAAGFAANGDVYNTVGCLTRIAANLTQALFALNERYYMRDKQVMNVVGGFAQLPEAYVPQVQQLLACAGSTAEGLTSTVARMQHVWRAVVRLPGVQYEPAFRL